MRIKRIIPLACVLLSGCELSYIPDRPTPEQVIRAGCQADKYQADIDFHNERYISAITKYINTCQYEKAEAVIHLIREESESDFFPKFYERALIKEGYKPKIEERVHKKITEMRKSRR